MKKKFVKDEIQDFIEARNTVHAYYVTYMETDNITSQHWDKSEGDLSEILDKIEKSKVCVQGELPIKRLIVYGEDQCMVFSENPLWDRVDGNSEDSHIVTIVPYIDKNGSFGKIMPFCPNRFGITRTNVCGDIEGFPVAVVVRMMEEQLRQTGKSDIEVFQKSAASDKIEGGFTWRESDDGFDFWNHVLSYRKFSYFYKKYDDYRQYD